MWIDRFSPKPYQCLVDQSSRQEIMADIRNPTFVNLKSLYSAFLYLFLGFIFSFLVFLIEWIRKLHQSFSKRL